MTVNSAAENAREHARKGDGKFGVQHRPDAPDGLIAPTSVDEPDTENLDTDLAAAEAELRDGTNPASLRFTLDDLRETTRNHLNELDRTGTYVAGTSEQPSRHSRLQAAVEAADTHPEDDDDRHHEVLTSLVNAVREYRDIPAANPRPATAERPQLAEGRRVQLPLEHRNDRAFPRDVTGKIVTEPYDQDGVSTVTVAYPWKDTVMFMRLPAASVLPTPPRQGDVDH
ncbi:hypothetical protein ACWGJ9_10935 [Curtobacterium citreum]